MIYIITLSLLFIKVTTSSKEPVKNSQDILHIMEHNKTGVTACSLYCFDHSKGLDQPKTFILPGKYSNNSIKLEVAIDIYKKGSKSDYSHPCQAFQFCVSGNFSGKRFDHYLYGYTITGFIDIASSYYSGMSISTITLMPLQEGSLNPDSEDEEDCTTPPISTITQSQRIPEPVIKEGCKPVVLQRYGESDDPTCIMYWDHTWDNYCDVGFFNSQQRDHDPLVFPLKNYLGISGAFQDFQSYYCKSLDLNQSYSVCISIGETPTAVTYHSYENITVNELLTRIMELYGEDNVHRLPFRNITIMAHAQIQSLPLINGTCDPNKFDDYGNDDYGNDDDDDDGGGDDDYYDEYDLESTPSTATVKPKKTVTDEYNSIFNSFDNFDL